MAECGPVNWFLGGVYPSCKCGYAPKDNALLNQHWAAQGFKIVDDHGRLKRVSVSRNP